MSRDYQFFVADIRKCCEKVNSFTAGMDQTQFEADERTYDPVIRNLEIIGEAAKNIPDEIR